MFNWPNCSWEMWSRNIFQWIWSGERSCTQQRGSSSRAGFTTGICSLLDIGWCLFFWELVLLYVELWIMICSIFLVEICTFCLNCLLYLIGGFRIRAFVFNGYCAWQIPGNTGCIARTCAASAVKLHLIEVINCFLIFIIYDYSFSWLGSIYLGNFCFILLAKSFLVLAHFMPFLASAIGVSGWWCEVEKGWTWLLAVSFAKSFGCLAWINYPNLFYSNWIEHYSS